MLLLITRPQTAQQDAHCIELECAEHMNVVFARSHCPPYIFLQLEWLCDGDIVFKHIGIKLMCLL